ncbi:MAG: hypothetical protein J5I47_04335 [Vicingus serpentipes]|nr:hypothetical protein [Vicingus serpentipes]
MAKTQITSPQTPIPKTSGLFSTEEYKKGDVKIKQEIGEQLNKYLLKGAGYLITTVLGGVIVVVWGMRGEISEIKGKLAVPDKYLEIVDKRLSKLEKENNELQTINYQLEIDKVKLEFELKNKNKNGN